MVARLIAALLCLLPCAAGHAAWHEATSAHFVVYSNDQPERLRAVASNLERFDRTLRVLLGASDAPVGRANRVAVYVVEGPAQVAALAGRPNVAGFHRARAGETFAVVPRGTGELDSIGFNAQVALFHEYTHHFVVTHWPHTAFPAWLTEGVAEFYSTAEQQQDGSILLGKVPQFRGWSLLRPQQFSTAALIGAKGERAFRGEDAEAFYGRSWLLTHYLAFEPSRRDQLAEYIDALQAGRSLQQAATVFGDLGVLQGQLDRYRLRPRLQARAIPADVLTIGAIAVRALSAGEAATMPTRIRSQVGVNRDTAPDVAADARRAASAHPTDAAAQIVLAEAEFDCGNLDAAEAATDRALATAPGAIEALLWKGRLRVARAQGASADKAAWAEARRYFLRANRADPSDPRPPIWFYRTFRLAGETPTPNARAGLVAAFGLAPHDNGLRFDAGIVLLRDGKLKQARDVLAPLATMSHRGTRAELAKRIVAAIDEGQSAGQIEPLLKEPPEGDGDTPLA